MGLQEVNLYFRVHLKEDNFKLPNNKNIKIAKNAGFCYGVKRAVETAKDIKAHNPDNNVYILGELIHNSQVIDDLSNFGIKTLTTLPDKGDGICIIRTHGESPEVIEQIKNAGFEPYDLTCPYVKAVQDKAVELVKQGYFLVIVGKAQHPEVIGIKGNAQQFGDNVIVAASVDELKAHEQELKSNKKIGVVVQTTQTYSTLLPIIEYLTTIAKELHISNTICPSTRMRQTEAGSLAQESDLMVVVGSKKSANTTHLADISKKITNTIHIEKSQDLEPYKNDIENALNIGITAGASTPQNIIDDVEKQILMFK